MPRRRKRAVPKRTAAAMPPQNNSQLLSSIYHETYGEYKVGLFRDKPFAHAASSALPSDTICSKNTSITELNENGKLVESIQNQGLLTAEGRFQLEVELTNKAGDTIIETRVVSADRLAQAQTMIANAAKGKEAEQNEAIDQAIQLLYPYPPREGQRDALRHIIYKRRDLILIAKTSFGKSMILQAVSVLMRKSITLIVLPLDQIGQEQAEYITRVGGRPCFLNADVISEKVLTEIQNMKYTHVLISPELAIGNKFHATAINPRFKERIGLVVVDEAHLVSQWGREFRTDYARLNQLRSLLGADTPWLACSATLDAEALNTLIEGVGFENDVAVMRTSIDRPELVFRTGWIPKNSRQKASALRFIFDEGGRMDTGSPSISRQIPKTIVFFDSKKDAYAAMQECRKWLQYSDTHQYLRKEATETIKVFQRDTAKFDKKAIIEEFQLLGKDSSIRVVFATEALGLGVNLPDVRRVVQYGLPKGTEPAILWQRGGRASRDGHDGEVILLMDDWVEGSRSEPRLHRKARRKTRASDLNSRPLEAAVSAEEEDKTSKLTPAERRSNLPDFWYELANEPGCLRDRFLDHFNEPPDHRESKRKDRCCSGCSPDLLLGKLDNHYLYSERGNRLNARRKKILESLMTWAKTQIHAAFPRPFFRPEVISFISTNQLMQLARDAHIITDLDSLHKALGSWRFFESHSTELLAILRTAHFHFNEEKAATNTPNRISSQTRENIQSGEGRDIWVSVETPLSLSQSVSSQTIASPPLPDPKPPEQDRTKTNLPAPIQKVVPTRRVLRDISGNVARKRPKHDKAEYKKRQEPIRHQELPASRFGRRRKASCGLLE